MDILFDPSLTQSQPSESIAMTPPYNGLIDFGTLNVSDSSESQLYLNTKQYILQIVFL